MLVVSTNRERQRSEDMNDKWDIRVWIMKVAAG